MNLPSYRRTYGPFVTLYRCSGGSEVELGCWFGSTAHASADACQQEDVLMLCGTKAAMKEPEMNTTTHPLPGTTKFTSHIYDYEARYVAHKHYDNIEHVVRCDDQSGKYHAVQVMGGWKALIGKIGDDVFILHKNDDGSRALEPVTLH